MISGCLQTHHLTSQLKQVQSRLESIVGFILGYRNQLSASVAAFCSDSDTMSTTFKFTLRNSHIHQTWGEPSIWWGNHCNSVSLINVKKMHGGLLPQSLLHKKAQEVAVVFTLQKPASWKLQSSFLCRIDRLHASVWNTPQHVEFYRGTHFLVSDMIVFLKHNNNQDFFKFVFHVL